MLRLLQQWLLSIYLSYKHSSIFLTVCMKARLSKFFMAIFSCVIHGLESRRPCKAILVSRSWPFHFNDYQIKFQFSMLRYTKCQQFLQRDVDLGEQKYTANIHVFQVQSFIMIFNFNLQTTTSIQTCRYICNLLDLNTQISHLNLD